MAKTKRKRLTLNKLFKLTAEFFGRKKLSDWEEVSYKGSDWITEIGADSFWFTLLDAMGEAQVEEALEITVEKNNIFVIPLSPKPKVMQLANDLLSFYHSKGLNAFISDEEIGGLDIEEFNKVEKIKL